MFYVFNFFMLLPNFMGKKSKEVKFNGCDL